MPNKSKGISPRITIITGAWAIPYVVGNEACDIKPAVIPVQCGAWLCQQDEARLLCKGYNAQSNCKATHNPSTSISGHVTVHLHPLAKLPVDGDGVDTTQRISIHQVLGTVLRVSKDTATCKVEIKEAKFKQSNTLLTCLGPYWL